jgi:hypothetical protein
VIANGGFSGLYPDQSSTAYYEALYQSLPGVALSCDLQLAKASNPSLAAIGEGICRTGLDLGASTNIAIALPNLTTTSHIVNGENVTGYFAVDIPFANITSAPVGACAVNLSYNGVPWISQVICSFSVHNLLL